MAPRVHLLVCALAGAVATLTGCADSSSTAPAVSDAQRLLGASLLPPQDSGTTADGLGADELPPDASATAELDAADLPPAP